MANAAQTTRRWGFEYQMLDDVPARGQHCSFTSCRMLFTIYPANANKAAQPVGEWNSSRSGSRQSTVRIGSMEPKGRVRLGNRRRDRSSARANTRHRNSLSAVPDNRVQDHVDEV